MIKRSGYIVILALFSLGILYLFKSKFSPLISPAPGTQVTKSEDEEFKIQGKRVVGRNLKQEQLKDLKVANTPSTEWRPALEKTLRLQGGDSLKEITLNKVDSFIWAQDGIALFVESVIVTLKNNKNAESTFRVLVDAQTGKILNNWDQPVFDPAHPDDNFKVRIDPRYHND